jgi:hypothetical protein
LIALTNKIEISRLASPYLAGAEATTTKRKKMNEKEEGISIRKTTEAFQADYNTSHER